MSQHPLAHLIEGDLFVVPVLDVEEQHNTAIFVPAWQDTRVPSLNGATDRLWGQVLKELGVVLPEANVAWSTRGDDRS